MPVFKVYLNAVIDAFANDIDYAVLHKIYGAVPANEARYSPAKCIGCEREAVLGRPDPSALHIVHPVEVRAPRKRRE